VLRRAGRKVVVLDKQAFPRDKPCAGWITPQVVETLQLDVEDYARTRTWQPISAFRCGVIGGRDVRVPYDRPISFGIRRGEFDAYLLERSGANCQQEPVDQIERRHDGWWVNGRHGAPLLVGAGGHFCPVRRRITDYESPISRKKEEGTPPRASPGPAEAAAPGVSSRRNRTDLVLAKEVEFRPTPDQMREVHVEAGCPELFFCRDMRGYGWCFRKGDFLNIGLGRVDPLRLSTHVAEFCDFLKERNRVPCEIPSRFVGHAYRLYERASTRLYDDGALLIGDAAGLAYPMSGEGIRPAVESGLIAADVILAVDGRYAADDLCVYETRILERFGQLRDRRKPTFLPAGWQHSLAARLVATRWFSRHMVMDRWFLRRHQPSLQLADRTLTQTSNS